MTHTHPLTRKTNVAQAGAAPVVMPQETANSNTNQPQFLCKMFSFEGTRSDVELQASFAGKICQ